MERIVISLGTARRENFAFKDKVPYLANEIARANPGFNVNWAWNFRGRSHILA